MSVSPPTQTFGDRIRGKWQLPLLLVASTAFVVVFIRLIPETEVPSISDRLALLQGFKSSLLLSEGEALARSILQDERYQPEQLGPVYVELGDILYRQADLKTEKNHRNLIRILAHYAQAEELGESLSGDTLARRGQVYDWLGQPQSALEQYERSLHRSPSDVLAVRMKKLSHQLSADRPSLETIEVELDEMLGAASDRPEILKWAIERKVGLLIQGNRLADAQAVVNRYLPQLKETPHYPLIQYLEGHLQFLSGDNRGAEITLRDLLSRLSDRRELDAQANWLLGRVVLQDDGPQRPMEAITFFENVLKSHPGGEYVVASKLGMAEALTVLQRCDEALVYYRDVLEDLKKYPDSMQVNRSGVIASLAVQHRSLQEMGQYDTALKYFQLASDLIEIDQTESRFVYLQGLAELKNVVAEWHRKKSMDAHASSRLDEAQAQASKSRELFLSAADDYLVISQLKIEDESISSGALWKAASMYDSAGVRRRTIEILEDFIVNRVGNPQLPQALFRLGQAYQAEGQLLKAIDHYRHCIQEYHRTDPAQRSIIPLADCYVLLGPDYAVEAEMTLLSVLENASNEPNIFTPQSYVYRDALFKLGDVYSRDGRHEEAIERLDEALQRYPEDPRNARATFLLADSYRQSGLALSSAANEVSNTIRRDEMMLKKRQRLELAEQLFGKVIEKLSVQPIDQLSEMQALQLKLSYSYRADCAYDLGEYARALEKYQEVERVYHDDPVTLAAYVQIISCLEFLGRDEAIGPAVQRAQWLTDKMSPLKLEQSLTRSQAENWRKLFNWLSQTAQDGNSTQQERPSS